MSATSELPRVVYLGNHNAYEWPDPESGRDLPGKRCTTVTIPAGWSLLEAVKAIADEHSGVWQAHSTAATPVWVASTDPMLAQVLSQHWSCGLRDPEPDHKPNEEA